MTDRFATVRFRYRLGRWIASHQRDPGRALRDEYRKTRKRGLVEMFRHLEAIACFEDVPDNMIGGRLSLVKLDESSDLGNFEWRFEWEWGDDPLLEDETTVAKEAA